jgi:hypothetical protein
MKYLIDTENIKLYIESISHIGSIYKIIRFESKDINESLLLNKEINVDEIINNINNSELYKLNITRYNTQYIKGKNILLNYKDNKYISPLGLFSFDEDQIIKL